MGSARPKNPRVVQKIHGLMEPVPSAKKSKDLPSLGFLENQETIEALLGSHSCEVELDRFLQKRYLSLRAVVREIPPRFASI
jgi:hypothetical protein